VQRQIDGLPEGVDRLGARRSRTSQAWLPARRRRARQQPARRELKPTSCFRCRAARNARHRVRSACRAAERAPSAVRRFSPRAGGSWLRSARRCAGGPGAPRMRYPRAREVRPSGRFAFKRGGASGGEASGASAGAGLLGGRRVGAVVSPAAAGGVDDRGRLSAAIYNDTPYTWTFRLRAAGESTAERVSRLAGCSPQSGSARAGRMFVALQARCGGRRAGCCAAELGLRALRGLPARA
jgi:hypothetical protein